MVSVLVKWSSLERLLFCVKQLPERAKDFDMILSNFAFILKKKTNENLLRIQLSSFLQENFI